MDKIVKAAEVRQSGTIRDLLQDKMSVEATLAKVTENLVTAIYNDPEARRFIKVDWQRMEMYYGLRPKEHRRMRDDR